MIAIKRSIIEKYIILSGSFLMISNAFKQFPGFNLITPEAPSRLVCFIELMSHKDELQKPEVEGI